MEMMWAAGAHVVVDPGSAAAVVVSDRRIVIDRLPLSLQDKLGTLTVNVPVDDLDGCALDAGGPVALAHWLAVRQRLDAAAAVTYSLVADGARRASFTPARAGASFDFEPCANAFRISRFAFLQRVGSVTTLDSPLARGPVQLHDPSLASLIFSGDELGRAPNHQQPLMDGLCALLVAAGLVNDVDAQGLTVEDRDPHRRSWAFADLLLHMRSRPTRHNAPIGATFPWRGELDPLPAVKPPMVHDPIALAVPSETASVTYDEIVASRRSTRTHGSRPLALDAVGRFLWRAARAVDPVPGVSSNDYAKTHRVYPSGGGCYPLEIYLVIHNCDGAAPGLYHYAPQDHVLEPLRLAHAEARALTERYSWIMTDGSLPQVLCIVTARFLRTAWKYEGIAYAIILKEVGVLYESMYLAATAEGVACCAAGTGIGPRFSELIGVDSLEESPVGEFIIGSKP